MANLRIPRHLGTLRNVGGAVVVTPNDAIHFPLNGGLTDAFSRAAPLATAGGLTYTTGLSDNAGWYTWPNGNTTTLATAHWLTQGTPDSYAGNVLTLKGASGLMPIGTTIIVGIDYQYSGDVAGAEEVLWATGARTGSSGFINLTVSPAQLLRFNVKLANNGAEAPVGTIDISGITSRISIAVEIQAISSSDLAVRMRAKHAGGTLSFSGTVNVIGSEAPLLQSSPAFFGLALGAQTSASGVGADARAVISKAESPAARSRLANFYARRLVAYNPELLDAVIAEQFASANVFPQSLRVA